MGWSDKQRFVMNFRLTVYVFVCTKADIFYVFVAENNTALKAFVSKQPKWISIFSAGR